MKFSVKDPAFPHFAPLNCSAYELSITCDGVEVRDCVAFDTVDGWADRMQRNAKGDIVVVKATHEPSIERLRGKVEVTKR